MRVAQPGEARLRRPVLLRQDRAARRGAVAATACRTGTGAAAAAVGGGNGLKGAGAETSAGVPSGAVMSPVSPLHVDGDVEHRHLRLRKCARGRRRGSDRANAPNPVRRSPFGSASSTTARDRPRTGCHPARRRTRGCSLLRRRRPGWHRRHRRTERHVRPQRPPGGIQSPRQTASSPAQHPARRPRPPSPPPRLRSGGLCLVAVSVMTDPPSPPRSKLRLDTAKVGVLWRSRDPRVPLALVDRSGILLRRHLRFIRRDRGDCPPERRRRSGSASPAPRPTCRSRRSSLSSPAHPRSRSPASVLQHAANLPSQLAHVVRIVGLGGIQRVLDIGHRHQIALDSAEHHGRPIGGSSAGPGHC